MAGNPQVVPEPVTIRARLLGPSEIAIGNRLLTNRDWSGRKARSLLLLLLCTRGHQLHREQVLDLLWPEFGADAGSNALYKALHGLRRTMEPDLRTGRSSRYVQTRDDMIGLSDTASIWVDVEQFAQILARAEIAPADERRRHLRNAVEIYRGDFIAEEMYADWPVARREALRADHERATLTLARLDAEAGEPLRTVPYLEALLTQDPALELVHRALMQTYLAGGERSLALRQFERCREVLELTYESEPEPETAHLAESIRQAPDTASIDVHHLASAARFSTLPSIPTPTIGREDEIADVARLLSDPAVRLVTITGAGGIGKTRLAIECATTLKGAFPDGIGFVPMAAIRDPGLLFDTIALALRIPEIPNRPVSEVVADYLRSRTSLLVLDNLEQVTAAGPAIADLIACCPDLTILATSRAPLRIRAERLYLLGVLGLPDPTVVQGGDDLANVESAALFLQSLKALRHDYALTAADVPVVAELCLRLEGLPLAIELAAARAHDLALADILAQLTQRARIVVLRDGPRDLPARQQTLHDLVLWSYDLLTQPEQMLFRRLAVFAGGVELDALEATGVENAVALASALAEKSLVAWTHVDGTRRLTMLETIREVALLLLNDAAEQEAMRERHAGFHASLATIAEPGLRGIGQVSWLNRLSRDVDNFRGALAWSLEAGGNRVDRVLEILAGAALFWFHRGHTQECAEWLEAALAHPGEPSPTRAAAATWAGIAAHRRRDEERRHHFEAMASALWEELDDPSGKASVLVLASRRPVGVGDLELALAMLEEALTLYRSADDTWGIVDAITEMSSVLQLLGRFDDAMTGLEEALVLAQDAGDLLSQSHVLVYLGSATVNAGLQERAFDVAIEGERIARLIDNQRALPWALYAQAGIAFYAGDFPRAVSLMHQVSDLFAELGDRRNLAVAQVSTAAMRVKLGTIPEAGIQFQAAISLIRHAGTAEDRLSTITEVAHFALATNQESAAVRLFAASASHSASSDEHLPVPDQERLDEAVASLRHRLAPPDFDRAWSSGAQLSLNAALDVAESACRSDEPDVIAAIA
jgi:predicted ATPase/DNA-binding SARP family transcriptional activator